MQANGGGGGGREGLVWGGERVGVGGGVVRKQENKQDCT